jgi:hypothetical protein
MSDEKNAPRANMQTGAPAVPTVDWDDSQMQSSYANVVNASSTREEVNLLFGTNETWKADETREFHVRLTNRIVLSPFAAKRLWVLLGTILKEYESRFGKLDVASPGGRIVTAEAPKSAGSPKVQ